MPFERGEFGDLRFEPTLEELHASLSWLDKNAKEISWAFGANSELWEYTDGVLEFDGDKLKVEYLLLSQEERQVEARRLLVDEKRKELERALGYAKTQVAAAERYVQNASAIAQRDLNQANVRLEAIVKELEKVNAENG